MTTHAHQFDILEPRTKDKRTLVAVERKPSPSREWVDKQRSMHTSLRGGGTTQWSLIRAKSLTLLVRKRIQSNSSIASVGTLCLSIVRGSKNQTDALCKSLVFSL